MQRPSIEIEDRHGYQVVTPIGELDFTASSVFAATLEMAALRSEAHVIVSFERISYFDSSVISCLIEFAKRLAPQRRELLVVAPANAVASRTFQVVGLHRMFMIFDSIAGAVDHAAGVRAATDPI